MPRAQLLRRPRCHTVRYGGYSTELDAATATLVSAVYNSNLDEASLEDTPSVLDSMSRGTNASGVLSALRSFVTAAPQVPAGAAGTFSYDLTDLHRQFLVDLFSDAHGALGGRFVAAASAFPPGNASVSVDALIELCRSIMATLDAALAADPNFLLGTWIDDSASWGQSDSDPEATARWVFNARTQLTMWGPVVGQLDDYAAKHWAGLVEGYYSPRWGVLFDGTLSTFAGSK